MPRVNVKDKRKQQLIEANIASIARRGLANTTISHVSKGAGMSRGIVNFYFTSKEKMMQETLQAMADEVTAMFGEALAGEREKGSEPFAIMEALLRILMGDRLCSQKRLVVWSAFMGHAGSHAPFLRIIRVMDDSLVSTLKKLGQEAGYDAKSADTIARQLLALVRGHCFLAVVGENEKRPSAYTDAWLGILKLAAPAAASKTISIKPAALRSKKPSHSNVLPGQLEFGDLFSH